jgi:ubiquinol-cytochrome c reductase cytochrome b subunit
MCNVVLKKYYIFRRDDIFARIVSSVAVDLPAPINISYLWNFGRLLFFFLAAQIVTGFLLATNYVGGIEASFASIDMIRRDVWGGWLIRYLHISGASFFFLFLYCHIGRGVYYHSFKLVNTWMTGVTIYLLAMARAFLGYVLPWGQMSYWGATVITNFFSVIPYVGPGLVIWIWGSFSVDLPTIPRFFRLHFLVPFILLALVGVHIVYLHETGSKNPLGLGSSSDKIVFFPYFLSKDVLGIFIVPRVLFCLFLGFPWYFMEYQNFIQANSLVTPPHIQPEWYFLSSYAVLRSIPRKLGGVVALAFFILILYFLPFFNKRRIQGSGFRVWSQLLFWVWVVKLIFLTWVGSCPVEDPFILLSRIGCFIYFFFYFLYSGWVKV